MFQRNWRVKFAHFIEEEILGTWNCAPHGKGFPKWSRLSLEVFRNL